ANLRRTRDKLADIYDARQRSRRVTRHTLTRRGSAEPVAAENGNAWLLHVLGDGRGVAVRIGLGGERGQQERRREALEALARPLGRLAPAPGDRTTRQDVVDHVPMLLEQLRSLEVPLEDPADTATRVTRVLAHDIMRYAGVAAEDARSVMQQDATEA